MRAKYVINEIKKEIPNVMRDLNIGKEMFITPAYKKLKKEIFFTNTEAFIIPR